MHAGLDVSYPLHMMHFSQYQASYLRCTWDHYLMHKSSQVAGFIHTESGLQTLTVLL